MDRKRLVPSGVRASMEPSVVTDLDALPGVARSTGLRFARPEFNGTIVYLIAVDTGPFSEMLSQRSDLAQLAKYRRAVGNRVLVSENFAEHHGVRIGDTVALAGANGPVRLEVIDTIVDYSWSRGTIIMDRSAYATLFGDTQIDIAHVFIAEGQEATARKAVITAWPRGVSAARPPVLELLPFVHHVPE